MECLKAKILVKEPHSQSLAALYKLHLQLLRHVPYHGYRGWLRLRTEVLEKWLAERGDLVCDYCGRPHLKIDAPANSDDIATLDHIIPRAKGGDKMNINNLVVACHPCNRDKKETDYLTFKSKRARFISDEKEI